MKNHQPLQSLCASSRICLLLLLVILSFFPTWAGWVDRRFGIGGEGKVGMLTEFKNEVYALGRFTRLGGVSANAVARWNNTNWVASSDIPAGSAYPLGTHALVYINSEEKIFSIGGKFRDSVERRIGWADFNPLIADEFCQKNLGWITVLDTVSGDVKRVSDHRDRV